jgi:broad specificity phosphatase PhoE
MVFRPDGSRIEQPYSVYLPFIIRMGMAKADRIAAFLLCVTGKQCRFEVPPVRKDGMSMQDENPMSFAFPDHFIGKQIRSHFGVALYGDEVFDKVRLRLYISAMDHEIHLVPVCFFHIPDNSVLTMAVTDHKNFLHTVPLVSILNLKKQDSAIIVGMHKKITFYYVRHGRTVYNKEGIMQGQVESPLTQEDLPVLSNTADALKDIPFTRCFSSPLSRAMDTARILLKDRKIPIEPEAGLKGMNFGDLDGKPHKEHPLRIGFLFAINDFKPVHGESGRELQERIRHTFETIVSECKDGDQVLITGHGTYFHNLRKTLFGKHPHLEAVLGKYHGIGNGDICVFQYEDGNWKMQEDVQNAASYQSHHSR